MLDWSNLVDIDILKKHGVSSGEYKKIFTMDVLPSRVQKLVDLITNRLKDGYNRNLAEHRIYAAIDLAYEAPFNQTTATLVQNLMQKRLSSEELLKELEKWGLKQDEMFLSVERLVEGKTQNVLIPNPPIFFNVLIPVVLSYCTARAATLFNERNTSPLLPYNPLIKTSRDRVICEVVTNLIQTISGWYGYQSYLDQAIKQMVKYGVSIAFPIEEWHCEEQIRIGTDGKEEYYTTKEGLRYTFPHPTRMFYDLYQPLTSLNSDTGVGFAANWHIVPYSDILDNRMYWNRDRVSFGTNWFDNPAAGNYFQEFYPCRLRFPTFDGANMRREDQAAFYSSAERDKAVFLTQFYMKLTPRDFGLGRYEPIPGSKKGAMRLKDTYDCPVWHRFVMAGDSTVIWCEPCAYPPNWFMGYNYDAVAGRQSSLGLETIPWQDHLGNIMTQMKLTCSQNLANVIWYDTNMVNKTDIENLNNLGERKYRGMNFMPFDSMKMSRSGGLDVGKAFIPSQLAYRSIQDMVQMMGQVLNIMERVLQFTAQEVGSTAQHYQSAEEIKTLSNSSSSRTQYIGYAVDQALDAWKLQLYHAAMAYMDTDFQSQVSSDIPNVDAILASLGFEVTGRTAETIMIKGKKQKLRVEGFMKMGGGDIPEPDAQVATVLFQTIGAISANPMLFQAIGADKIVALLEQAAKMAGADKDFKLPVMPQQPQPPGAPGQPPTGAGQSPAAPAQPSQPDIQAQLLPVLKQLQAQTLQIVEEKIAKPAAQQMAKQEAQIQALDKTLAQLEKIVAAAAKSAPQIQPGAPPVVK